MDAKWIGAVGTMAVLAAMACGVRRKLPFMVYSLSVQGVLLAAIAFMVGLSEGYSHMFVAAVLALTIKGIVVPLIVGRVARRVDASREPHGIGTTRAAIMASGLILLVYAVIPDLGHGVANELLSPAITMVMLGFLLIVTRRLAITQVIGLITMENGVFLAGVGLTYGIPVIVELGILLDLLIGLAVMGILISRMHEAFSSTDVSHLRQLKG